MPNDTKGCAHNSSMPPVDVEGLENLRNALLLELTKVILRVKDSTTEVRIGYEFDESRNFRQVEHILAKREVTKPYPQSLYRTQILASEADIRDELAQIEAELF